MSKKSISQITAEALQKMPFVGYGLDEKIINMSALAEKIKPEIESEWGKKVQTEAIKTAIRRYAEIRKKTVDSHEIQKILNKSRLLLRNNIGMIVTTHASYKNVLEFQKKIQTEDYLNVLQITSGIILIMDEHNLKEAEKIIGQSNLLEKKKGLAAIIIVSPQEIEDVKGWVSFVSSLMAYNGINMEDDFSSYTDTTIIVKREDAIKSFELLESVMK